MEDEAKKVFKNAISHSFRQIAGGFEKGVLTLEQVKALINIFSTALDLRISLDKYEKEMMFQNKRTQTPPFNTIKGG